MQKIFMLLISIISFATQSSAQAPNYIAEATMRNDCRYTTQGNYRDTTFSQSGSAAGPTSTEGTYTWTQSGSTSGGSVSMSIQSKVERPGTSPNWNESYLACPVTINIYAKNHGTHVVAASGTTSLSVSATPGNGVNGGEIGNYYPYQNASFWGSSSSGTDSYSGSPSGSNNLVVSTKGAGCSANTSISVGGTTYYRILNLSYSSLARMAKQSDGTSDFSGSLSLTPAPPTYQAPSITINGPNNITTGNNTILPFAGEQLQFPITAYDPDDGTTPNGIGNCGTSYTIKNGAGTTVASSGSSGFISTVSFTPTYGDDDYLLTYTFTDNEGVSANATKTFHVNEKRVENARTGNCGTGSSGVSPKAGNSNPSQPSGGDGPIGGDGCSYSVVDPATGNAQVKACDPVSTRGYPLRSNIYVNSMRRRWTGLTGMGNAEFSYGIRYYQPSLISPARGYIVDGNGMEHDYGVVPGSPGAFTSQEGGVYGTLTLQSGGGYILSGAGAPESINNAGNFTYEFDGTGRLIEITDPSGNLQQLNYTGGLLGSVDDLSSGRSITFTHDGYGNIQTVTEGAGEVVTELTYDSGTHSLLTDLKVKNSLGVTIRRFEFGYNGQGLVSSVKQDSDTNKTVTVTYTYAGLTNAFSLTRYYANLSWSGGGTNYDYFGIPSGSNPARTVRTNAQSQKENTDYDLKGNVVRFQGPVLNGQSSAATITATFDSNRNPLTWTDGTTSLTMTYNSLGKLLTLSDNASRSWTYTYSGVDLTSISDAIGTVLTLTYGDASNPHSPTIIEDNAGNEWTYTYNSYGQVLTMTPPTGSPTGATAYTYEETGADPDYGWLESVTNGAGDVVTFDSYSPLGDPLSITSNPSSGVTNTIQYQYDALRRITRTTQPDAKYEERVYDGRDLTDVTDEAGTLSSYTHCPTCSQVTGAVYPMSKSLVWNLNGDFRTTSFVDARNYSTTFQYGNAGELKKITYPDSFALDFSYKQNGLLEYESFVVASLKYSYDNARRLAGVSLTGNNTYQIQYTYRADDQPNTITDESGVRTYSYYSNRWLEKVSYNLTSLGISNTQEVIYTYNPDGTVDTLIWKNGGTTVQSWDYTYDGAGRLTQVANSLGESTSYAYDGEGKITTITNSNGTSEVKTYNEDRNWPTLIEQKSSGTTFESFALEYDGGADTVGNLTETAEYDGSVVTYGYDALYRLTSEVRTGTGAYTKSYDYDLANNVTTINGSAFATYDNANKFSTISGGSRTYSTPGNLTAASYTGFSLSGLSYDNRFKLTTTPSREHKYNAEGYRGASRPSSGSWTAYIYDGDTIIGEVTSSGAAVAYTWGPEGLISERILSGTPKSLWYHYGPQGETRHLTNSSGTVTDSYRYSAYGIPTATSGSNPNPYRYGGKFGYYTDPNVSNVVLAGHRWYSPGLYRWMSRDPIRYDGGDNTYVYVNGNPVRWKDPLGLDESCKLDPIKRIWICERPVYGPIGNFIPNHQYVCCSGPNKNCYGHQDNSIKKGDIVPSESPAVGACTEKQVSCEDYNAKCNNPIAPCDGDTLDFNCRHYANSNANPMCPRYCGMTCAKTGIK